MKTRKIYVLFIISIVIMGMISCTNSPEKKAEVLENAKENVVVAEQDYNAAVNDSIDEYIRYKTETEAKLVENELKIAALKRELKAEKNEVRTKYEKQLTELEQKNAALKVNVSEYNDKDVSKWEKFKKLMDQDIEEIKVAISKMAENRK